MSPLDSAAQSLRFALKLDHLIVAADLHVKEALERGRTFVVIGGADAGVAERLAAQVLDRLDFGFGNDDVLRLKRLVDDVAQRRISCQHRIRSAGGDRHEVEVSGQPGRDHRPALQFDPARVEALFFEEALVHRDVAWDVQADAADDLADGDLGLRLRRAGAERKDDGNDQNGRPRISHGVVLPGSAYAGG